MSSGEASGDHYISSLILALKEAGYDGELWGVGGIEAENTGLNIYWKGDSLQLMGIAEVITSIPALFRLANDIVKKIMEKLPEAVIVVDSPDFHLPLIKKIRKAGYKGKIFLISPPTVWAWRSYRIKTLKKYVDMCLPIFKFENEYLQAHNCKSSWIGTPLLEDFYNDEQRRDSSETIENDGKIVAFLPGSRKSEIKELLPIMEEAAEEIASKGWTPIFSVAPGLNRNARKKMIKYLKEKKINYYEGSGKDLMKVAQCAIVASGTITVEALIIGCYLIVTYKTSKITAFLIRLILKIKYAAMTNILLQRELYPELLQENATKENIVTKTFEWLYSDENKKAAITNQMNEARLLLGKTEVYKFWANKILEELANA